MTRGRTNTYDFLRLLAALAVVVQHATVHLDAGFLWVEPADPWWFYDGVVAFFIISGLFVFRSAERLHRARAGWTEFYVNRGLRIVPAIWTYLTAMVVLVLAVGAASLGDLATVPGIGWVVTSLGLVPVYTPGFLRDFGVGSVNGSLWTIPVEVSFYVIVPLLVMAAHRLGRGRFWVGLAAVAVGAGVLAPFLPGMVGKLYGLTFLPHLWFFALGIGWHFLRHRVRLRGWVAALSALGYVAVSAVGVQAPDDYRHLFVMVAAVPLSYAIVWLGEHGPEAFSRFTKRIGDLSFGAYIWHMPIINTALWSGVDVPGIARVPLVIGLTLAAAWLSWTLVERPALARKRVSSRSDHATSTTQAQRTV